jgi:hypothetical protein
LFCFYLHFDQKIGEISPKLVIHRSNKSVLFFIFLALVLSTHQGNLHHQLLGNIQENHQGILQDILLNYSGFVPVNKEFKN